MQIGLLDLYEGVWCLLYLSFIYTTVKVHFILCMGVHFVLLSCYIWSNGIIWNDQQSVHKNTQLKWHLSTFYSQKRYISYPNILLILTQQGQIIYTLCHFIQYQKWFKNYRFILSIDFYNYLHELYTYLLFDWFKLIGNITIPSVTLPWNRLFQSSL